MTRNQDARSAESGNLPSRGAQYLSSKIAATAVELVSLVKQTKERACVTKQLRTSRSRSWPAQWHRFPSGAIRSAVMHLHNSSIRGVYHSKQQSSLPTCVHPASKARGQQQRRNAQRTSAFVHDANKACR
jgi:hypothetical protein